MWFDDVRFDWRVLEDPNVAVLWYAGSRQIGQRLFGAAQAALRRLSATIDAQPEYPIRVVVYANEDDFRSAFPYLKEWAGGRTFVEAALIVLYADSDEVSLTWAVQQGIPHEISHILFHQATVHPYSLPPTWLDEGLAMYSEEASCSSERALVTQTAQRGELLSLAQISGSFSPEPDAARLSYAESLSAVEFIL